MEKLSPTRFWKRKESKLLAVIPKAGNTSFMRLVDHRPLTIDQIMQFDTRVQFIRDPLARWISAYSFFYAINEEHKGGEDTKVPRLATHNGYEAWVDYALENENGHWYPQMKLSGGLATHLYKFNFENIRGRFAEHWSGRLPDWLNACTHLPINEYRINDIRDYYAEDFAAYEAAL